MVAMALPVAAQQYGLPAMLQGVGIEQKLNSQLPLEARFRDETGAPVRLGNYFQGRPVIVNLVYYQCPMLCTMVLTGMVNTLRRLSLNPGTDFDIVTISFDPSETPQLAAAKRQTYLTKYNRAGAAASWHFLTGDESQIRQVAGAIGFHYRWDDRQKAWAHASGIFIATPDGTAAINGSGNPGMASGGMGDVLTGIIVSLLGQQYSAWDACRLGVFIHGYAADLVAEEKGEIGICASDVKEMLPYAYNRLIGNKLNSSTRFFGNL